MNDPDPDEALLISPPLVQNVQMLSCFSTGYLPNDRKRPGVKHPVPMLLKLMLGVSLLCAPTPAAAQIPSVVGTWALVAAIVIRPNGDTTDDYGPGPRGLAVFTADGHYLIEIYRVARPRFAANDKQHGTADEYRQASLGMSAHFGTFQLDTAHGTLTFSIEGASFPNWEGLRQVRQFTLAGDTLSWRVPPRSDGSVPVSRFVRVR